MTSSGKNGLTSEQLQVPNGTGPGVRRSKRALLASCTRHPLQMFKGNFPEFGNIVENGNRVQLGKKVTI